MLQGLETVAGKAGQIGVYETVIGSPDALFEKLDEYVDLELQGAPADEQVPGMRAHLEGCPASHEEYASLRALTEPGEPNA